MEFPIADLLDFERCVEWIIQHFHLNRFACPNCRTHVTAARPFRKTKRSQLIVYRCRSCEQPYNLYSGTVFEQHHLTPPQVVLLVRGVVKGESSRTLASELKLNYQSVLHLRHQLQATASRLQPTTPLADTHTETDEMFQNAGEKRRQAS